MNVAVIAPTDGDYKYYSEELINGAKVAVDEINENGGLKGKKSIWCRSTTPATTLSR